MKRKSIIAAVLAVFILMTQLIPAVYATDTGSTVYSLVIKSKPVCAFGGTVTYPSDSLRVSSVRLCDPDNSCYTESEGVIGFNATRTENTYDFSGGAELISVEFTVIGEFDPKDIRIEMEEFFTVEQYEPNENEPFEYSCFLDGRLVEKGHVDIDDDTQTYRLPDEFLRLPGDVNSDGAVDINDATDLQRYLLKWQVPIEAANADVNADGKLNMKDVVLIQQYINNWDVVLK